MRKRNANGDHSCTTFNGDNENDNASSCEYAMRVDSRAKSNVGNSCTAPISAPRTPAATSSATLDDGAPAYQRQTTMYARATYVSHTYCGLPIKCSEPATTATPAKASARFFRSGDVSRIWVARSSHGR